MDEYIKRSDVIERIRKMASMIDFKTPAIAIACVIRSIERASAVDVIPSVCGHWERVYEDGVGWVDRCCYCKSISKDVGKHCSNCGAVMKGG